MNSQLYTRFRKDLRGSIPRPAWPRGVRSAQFNDGQHARQAHDLLVQAYRHRGGHIGSFSAWWGPLRDDAEYDPALVFLALDASGDVVGLAQCWTSSFIKDLAVLELWRRRGVGEALLLHAFIAFQERGFSEVDLKVENDNPSNAMHLYRRLGMKSVV